MVYHLLETFLAHPDPSLFMLFGHGSDPTPLAWDEALANLVKFGVTFILIAFLSYPVLAPLLTETEVEDTEEGTGDAEGPSAPDKTRSDIVGWIAVALITVLAVGWWLARTSFVEVMTEEQRIEEDHAHTQEKGGQVAMWGDFHAEVVRIESGEVRVYLRDAYNRDIAARYFEAEIQPIPEELDPEKAKEGEFLPTKPALNDAYRFSRLSRELEEYRVKVTTPGWSTTLKMDFDGGKGRRSLPIWCAPPGR